MHPIIPDKPDPGAYYAAVSALRRHASDLAVYLGTWAGRDDAKAQPDVRQAANHAMDAIDAALRELHGLRARLVSEIRESDDAAVVRAEELLRRIREENRR